MQKRLRDGTLIEQKDGQDRMLQRLYGHAFGRVLLKPLVRPWISKFVGSLLSTRCSCVLIKSFVKKHGIDLGQYETETYRSYNDFFVRRIRPELRPVDREPTHLISPCDSKLTVLPVTPDCRFSLKHTEYSVASLLKNDALAAEYAGGYVMIFRLTVDDYHRYFYVADGEKEENVRIAGKLHTVNPIANDYFPIYKENSREYCVVHTAEFGDLVMVEVGALLVGRIVNHHGAASVRRGQEKGYFQFGGSTVVLLLKKDTAIMDPDILENSQNGIETVVKFGEKIGAAR